MVAPARFFRILPGFQPVPVRHRRRFEPIHEILLRYWWNGWKRVSGARHRSGWRGHLTRSIFDRYNFIEEDDLADAGKRLEDYAAKRNLERAAKLRLVK